MWITNENIGNCKKTNYGNEDLGEIAQLLTINNVKMQQQKKALFYLHKIFFLVYFQGEMWPGHIFMRQHNIV